MKYLVILSLLLPLNSISQSSIGLKIGYSDSWEYYGEQVISELPDEADISIDGFNASVPVNFNLGGKLRLSAEPGYIKRGAACEPGFFFIDSLTLPEPFVGDTKLHLNYAQLPLILSIDIPVLVDKLKLTGGAGYGLSYLVSARREVISFSTDDIVSDAKVDIGNDGRMKRLDHGAYLTGGFIYDLGRYSLLAEVNHYRGSINAERFNISRNRSVSCNLGLVFDL